MLISQTNFNDAMYLSDMTMALLRDTGWYTNVNPSFS